MNSQFRFNKKLSYFEKGEAGDIDFQAKKNINTELTLYGFIFCITLGFFIIFLRLFQLTVVKGEYYSRLSDGNRVREITIEQNRGTIVDRKGFVIAHNITADITKLGERIFSQRKYIDAVAFAHLIGYRQSADQNNLQNDRCLQKAKSGDKVGKKGIEKLFECDLRGIPGKKLIEVDARGEYIKTLTVIPPVDGTTIRLAVDYDLQKKTFDLVKNKKAAIVAMKPQTGEILLLVSSPSYSPQDFEDGNSSEIEKNLTSKDKTLFNRATEAVYPPGSIFKLILAAGGLEEKKVDEKTIVIDNGVLKAGALSFGNWYYLQYGKTEGPVDIVKAIRRSNDIYFYTMGAKLGAENIRKWADIFGYGRKTGIGIDESEGLLPSPFWKKETLKENWYLGDTYNYAIGQGYVQATPLQITQATSAIANNGKLCKPQLLKVGPDQSFNASPNCSKLPISQKTLDLIHEGMKQACSSGGTGWPLFNFGINKLNPGKPITSTDSAHFQAIQTGCKTGTAESAQEQGSTPHAWITAYAPYENPQIVLTVLVEEGGQGSDIAGPIAHDILKAYFERKE